MTTGFSLLYQETPAGRAGGYEVQQREVETVENEDTAENEDMVENEVEV